MRSQIDVGSISALVDDELNEAQTGAKDEGVATPTWYGTQMDNESRLSRYRTPIYSISHLERPRMLLLLSR